MIGEAELARVTKTVRAELDLDEIWLYIAADSPAAADTLLDTIGARCHLRASQPLSGRLRLDLGMDLRSFIVKAYVIFYRPLPDGIEIIRVLHGARDVGTILQDRDLAGRR